MHAAAFNDQVECLQLLLSRGGNVDAVDQCGKTPLIMAADNGHAGAVGEFMSVCLHSIDKIKYHKIAMEGLGVLINAGEGVMRYQNVGKKKLCMKY